jgi:hypothetical protein
MIDKPTTAQLIDAVRNELRARVAPFVTDPIARIALDMSILVLGTAAVRSEHELAWMLQEADAIEALAGELIARLPVTGSLAQALADYEHGKGEHRDIADLHAHYARASELLARAAEAAYDCNDSESIRRVTAVFEQRRDNQNTISGGYEAVGRS